MKKFIAGFIAGGILCSGITIFASNGIKEAYFNDEIKVKANGTDTGVKAVTVVTDDNPDGSTYLPLRKAAEVLGKDIQWDGNTNTANIVERTYTPASSNSTTDGNVIKTEIKNGYIFATINGEEYYQLAYIANNLNYKKGYMFIFENNKYRIDFNNEPNGDTTKTKTILNNVETTIIEDRAFVSKSYYEKVLVPLLK